MNKQEKFNDLKDNYDNLKIIVGLLIICLISSVFICSSYKDKLDKLQEENNKIKSLYLEVLKDNYNCSIEYVRSKYVNSTLGTLYNTDLSNECIKFMYYRDRLILIGEEK